MKNHILSKYIFDIIIIAVNIAAGRGNILFFKLLNFEKSTWVAAIVIVIDIIYLLIRHNRKKTTLKYLTPAKIFLFLLGYNVINIMIQGYGDIILCFEYFTIMMLFYIIMKGVCSTLEHSNNTFKSSILLLSSGYIGIALFSILGSLLSFILMSVGFNWETPINADFLADNIEHSAEYVWAFFTVKLVDPIIRVPFFQEQGILCGLFHEPHILAFNVFPCIFLLFGFQKNNIQKIILILISILMLLFSGSTTSIFTVLICLMVYFMLNLYHKFWTVLFSILLLATIIYYYYLSDSTLFEFIGLRVLEDNDSKQTSEDLLKFAFTPTSLFGTNFLSTTFVLGNNSSQDIGYIPFILNIIFIIFFVINIFKLIATKNKITTAIAFASLYFLIHSAKVGMSIYIQTLTMMLLYIQSYTLTFYGRINNTKKSL